MIEHIARITGLGKKSGELVTLELNCTEVGFESSSSKLTPAIVLTIKIDDPEEDPGTIVVTRDDFVDAIDMLRLYGGSRVKTIEKAS